MIKITLDGEYTDLNTYIKELNYNRYAGNDLKQFETSRVFMECKNQRVRRVKKYPVVVEFNWYCKNEKKDIDNVAFSKKFILDGLVSAGFTDKFFIDKQQPRVEIIIK